MIEKKNKSKCFETSIKIIGLCIGALLLCMVSPINPISNSLPATDSSVFITIAKGMSNGKVPYLDFFDHKGILLYCINFIGYSVAGLSGVWVVEVFFLSLTLIVLFFTTNLITEKYNFIVTIVFSSYLLRYYEGGNLTEEYALLFITISLYYFTKYFYIENNISLGHAIIHGICCGATMLLRPNMFGIWAAFCTIITIENLIKKKYKEAVVLVLGFLIGLIIIIIPFVIYLTINGAMDEFLYQYLTFNSSSYASVGGIISVVNLTNQFLYYIYSDVVFIMILVLSLIMFILKDKWSLKIYYGGLILSVVINVLLMSVSESTYSHYRMVLIPFLVIVMSAILAELIEKNAIIAITVLVFINLYRILISAYFVYLDYGSTNELELLEICYDIEADSSQGDTIMSIGAGNNYYIYLDMEASSKYIYQYPIATVSETVRADIEAEFKENNPNYLIITAEVLDEYYNETDIFNIKEILEEKYVEFINEDDVIVLKLEE